MLTVIGLAVFVFFWHRSKTTAQQAETKKIQKESKDPENGTGDPHWISLQLEKTVSPGVPVTGPTVRLDPLCEVL